MFFSETLRGQPSTAAKLIGQHCIARGESLPFSRKNHAIFRSEVSMKLGLADPRNPSQLSTTCCHVAAALSEVAHVP